MEASRANFPPGSVPPNLTLVNFGAYTFVMVCGAHGLGWCEEKLVDMFCEKMGLHADFRCPETTKHSGKNLKNPKTVVLTVWVISPLALPSAASYLAQTSQMGAR